MEAKRILVADDDETLRLLLNEDLGSMGFSVRCVCDGTAAVGLALSEDFDVLLLDVMMPGMDGYHVAHEVQRLKRSKAPKIIIMTGRNTKDEGKVALMSGASAVLQKPFDLTQLHKTLAAILGEAPTRGGKA